MRPRLKDFFSFEILILICFNAASSPAQDLTYPVAVSPLIGDTIDIGERARYGLFPKMTGFRHGEFYLQADSTLVARVTFDSGNGLRDTILTRLGTLAFMHGHLEGID